ncbi:DUF1810 domain-containing protein [Cucumibacter marinus]|uniref:DUF1810 domain-containing protein n=1 Tax=Cucumibacter marinus TaxID=1121252 RepID=UPI0006859012|nr:DUF1810 domain-containing protein [Cucumibacter marinus]
MSSSASARLTRPAYDFSHFLTAQDKVFDTVMKELRAGKKRSHWMWFIFPQIAGLGGSPMSQRFALHSLAEAGAYLDHPVLGARLRAATMAVLAHAGPADGDGPPERRANEIFGSPDDLKFQSSMTLFHRVVPDDGMFWKPLAAFYDGHQDYATLRRLGLE